MKYRVIVFNGYYFPAKNYGGPSTSVENMIEACSNEIDFFVIVVNHDFGDSTKLTDIKPGWNNHGKAQVLYVDDKEFTTKNIRRWIRELKPSSIYLSGVLSPRNLRYIFASKKERVHVIVPPRGEVNDNAVKRKAYKKRPYFVFLKLFSVYKKCIFHATSQAEADGLKKYLGISQEKIILLPNVPKKIVYGHPVEKKTGRLHAVYIARICRTKNLAEALNALSNVNGRVVYDIYGPIEDEQYWKECQDIISSLPDNIKVSYLGLAEPKDVQNIYLNCDCTILPTVTENYGHSIVEALTAGCPCIIPCGTTPWDLIEKNAGFTSKLGDILKLKEIIQIMIEMNSGTYTQLIESTYKFANDNLMPKDVLREYVKMFSGGNRKQ